MRTQSRLFIHATNVHQGGGAVLLSDMLRAIPPDMPAVVFLDERMIFPDDLPAHVRTERVRPSLLGRLMAEFRLFRQVAADDFVLCFGNLPPLFRSRGCVSVFLQNRYLVDEGAPLRVLLLKSRIRVMVERAWLIWCRDNARCYIVQTPSMKRLAEDRLGVAVICSPFVPEKVMHLVAPRVDPPPPRFDFLYVASGEAHKNHATLISAWRILAEEGVYPSLALTLSSERMSELIDHVSGESASGGLHIHNLGPLPYDALIALYRESGALIYPSGFESFGLPLVEARLAGLPVLAPELDYVRDITDPEESFDPRSPVSIARAVKRFLQGRRIFLEPLGVKSFLDRVTKVDAL